MYKFLLATRYLGTRFIAFASIISVTLGVATMIVVNSVMAGFSTQMKERIHGILADVIVESFKSDGQERPEEVMSMIESLIGDDVAAMTPTVEIYGIMQFEWLGESFHRPVTIVGILPEQKNQISGLSQYLATRQEGHRGADEPLDWELTETAIEYRKRVLEIERMTARTSARYDSPDAGAIQDPFGGEAAAVPSTPVQTASNSPDDLFGPAATNAVPVDPDAPNDCRVYIGKSMVSFAYVDKHTGEVRTQLMVQPGEDVNLSTIKAGTPQVVGFRATVVDTFQSGMSEYDSQLVFCNLEQLQKARGMLVQIPGQPLDWRNGSVTSIQIKLKDYASAPAVLERLRSGLPRGEFQIRTWEQKQGPLLEAVEVESAILNVLLFLIIAVAGFGILAIFYMIVVEKTRDIGIIKALGASSRGVMAIFLSYGLSLGIVGAGGGVILGLLFVHYINQIEDFISWLTGRTVFDETIYYFKDIPTNVQPSMVLWVAAGAMLIAILASVLPARRAAQMHPVQALRYE